METTTLEFRWTVSRWRDTCGYNICTLYADGRRVARCNGGGYDMEGTCLGHYLAAHFADRLLALKPDEMPAQSHWQPAEKPRWFCSDAGCGGKVRAGKASKFEDAPDCPKCGKSMRPAPNDGARVDEGRYFYGLSYIDPDYDPSQAVVDHAPVFGKDEDVGKTVAQLEAEGKSLGLERYQAFWSATSRHPTERHTVPSIDGACGKSSVEAIGKAIGLTFEYVPCRSKKTTIYRMRDAAPATA